MNIIFICMIVDNVKKFWQKYNVVLFISVCIYAAYLTFSPKDVTIIKTEHTSTVVDTTNAAKWEAKYNSVQNMLNQFSSSEDYTIDEQYDPVTGKLISRKIQKKTTTASSNSSSNTVSTSTSSTTVNVSHSSSTTDVTTITTTEKAKVWSTIVGYNYSWSEIMAGQGLNLGKSVTVGVMVQYRILDVPNQSRLTLAPFGMFRY